MTTNKSIIKSEISHRNMTVAFTSIISQKCLLRSFKPYPKKKYWLKIITLHILYEYIQCLYNVYIINKLFVLGVT